MGAYRGYRAAGPIYTAYLSTVVVRIVNEFIVQFLSRLVFPISPYQTVTRGKSTSTGLQ